VKVDNLRDKEPPHAHSQIGKKFDKGAPDQKKRRSNDSLTDRVRGTVSSTSLKTHKGSTEPSKMEGKVGQFTGTIAGVPLRKREGGGFG